MKSSVLTTIILPSLCAATASLNYTANANSLLTKSMAWMDTLYDTEAGYLYASTSGALQLETRSSAWYAVGLLARNSENDAAEAAKVIRNIVSGQFQNASEQWYGDYTIYPAQPSPGTEAYPAEIYGTWDPNWRGFIGTAFIVAYEEFPHLLSGDLKDLMLESLHLNAIGDTYRVGGVDGDNLYPAYSNAAIMHTAVSAWVGRATNDSNITAEGEHWAHEIVDLFNIGNALGEFNSPTYEGVSLWALTLWAKYVPQDSVAGANARDMISKIWSSLGKIYNANLKDQAGPWDRSYGLDMNRYMSIMGLWIWAAIGQEASPNYKYPEIAAHRDDYEFGPLIAVLGPYALGLASEEAVAALHTFPDDGHWYNTSVISPAYDLERRNISIWNSPNLTIGAESFVENVVGGPAVNPEQFNPAVVQWLRSDGSVGFLTLYPETEALDVEVGEGMLELSYPDGNCSSRFSLLVSPNPLGLGPRNVMGWEDVERVNVSVGGTVDTKPKIGYCGLSGGTCEAIQ